MGLCNSTNKKNEKPSGIAKRPPLPSLSKEWQEYKAFQTAPEKYIAPDKKVYELTDEAKKTFDR